MTFTWKFGWLVFFPINNSSLHRKQKQNKTSSFQNQKATQSSVMHPLKIYSTSVSVCKGALAVASLWSTIPAALHPREQLLSPPQSNYHGDHQLLHEDPPHLFVVPSASLISAALHILERRPGWCRYLFNRGRPSWPARAHVWRHRWIYFCTMPLVPIARCGVLNQNIQLSICNTNFLTWISWGHGWDLLKHL